MDADCPLCGRPMRFPSRHHLVPRSEGGTEAVVICRDCHDVVHAVADNRELAARLRTVEDLRADPPIARALAFLARRPSVTRTRTRRPRRRR